MKNKIFISLLLFAICYLQFAILIHAQSPTKKLTTTPSVAPTEQTKFDELSERISDLKERIASRVAELNLVEKRGIIGTVTEVSDTQVTMTDIDRDIRIVNLDEISKFTSASQKDSFGISDITKGTKLSVIGLYNKQSRKLLGRYVNTFIIPVFINGQVISMNDDEFSIKVLSEDGKETTVDIETVTKTSTYTKEDGVQKAGFSKITPGIRVIIFGFPDKKNPRRVIASRALLLAELPQNPRITVPDAALQNGDEITPSAGSGKKLTPIR